MIEDLNDSISIYGSIGEPSYNNLNHSNKESKIETLTSFLIINDYMDNNCQNDYQLLTNIKLDKNVMPSEEDFQVQHLLDIENQILSELQNFKHQL